MTQDSPSVQTRQIKMSGSNKTSSEDIKSESSEINIKVEMSSRDESGEEFIPVIRLSEAPLFIHDNEIEIKYEDMDYNNCNSTQDLASEPGYDLDFETISKTRAEFSSTAIRIQSEVDESIVKMESSEENEEMESDSKIDFVLGGSDSGPDYCPTYTSTHLTRNMHRQSLQNNDVLHGSIISEARKRIDQFKCSECGKGLSRKDHLTVHMRSHTGKRPYTCEECAKSFSRKNALTRHMMTHTGEKPYTCEHCQESFTRLGNLTSHTRTHTHTRERPYRCEECGQYFLWKNNLISHMRIHTGEKPYSCEQCEHSFNQKCNLIVHKRIHTGEKPHKCPACEMNFTNSSDLTRHKRIHTGERPYRCNVCGKSFTLKGTLTKHMRAHTGEKPYKCDTCHKCFTTSSNLNRHQTAVHWRETRPNVMSAGEVVQDTGIHSVGGNT